jgi:hypothetical protein
MVMSDIKLLEKSGGKSGEWKAGKWALTIWASKVCNF